MKYSIAALFLTAGLTAHAQSVISWNVDVYGTVSGASAYAGVVSAPYWNDSWQMNGNGTGATVTWANLIDSTGAATSLSVTGSSFQNSWNYWSIQGSQMGVDGDGTWNRALLIGYNNKGSSEAPGLSTVSLSTIPYAQYDLYVYFSSDTAGRAGTVNVGSTTYDFSTLGLPSISGANAVLTPTTDTGGANPGADYAVFSGLSGASQTINVSIPNWGGIAGFQIVSVPEPGTLALAGMGCLTLLSLARRKTNGRQ